MWTAASDQRPALGVGENGQERGRNGAAPSLCSGFGAGRPAMPRNQFAPRTGHPTSGQNPTSGQSILSATRTLLSCIRGWKNSYLKFRRAHQGRLFTPPGRELVSGVPNNNFCTASCYWVWNVVERLLLLALIPISLPDLSSRWAVDNMTELVL